MAKFFALCGEYQSFHLVSSGSFPSVRWTVVFEYSKGRAQFDGEKWNYELEGV